MKPQPVSIACRACALVLGGALSTWGADGYLRVGVASQGAPTEPMPARLVFYHVESGQYVQTFATEEETRGNRFGHNTWPSFTLQGVHHPRRYLSYRLPEGTYRVTAGRGMSWYPGTAQAVVAAGATTTLSLVLQRIVDTEARGWFAGDGHVHVEHGGGAETPTNEWFRLWGEAAGLNWLSLSQEYLGAGAVDLAGQQAYVRGLSNATFQCWLGGERPKSALGHLAAVLPDQNPWQILDEPPYYVGAEQVRRAGGVAYPVHVDRLFPGGNTSSFKYNNFYLEYPLDALLGPGFDAFSVASNSESGYNARALGYWYALLDRGARLAAMADSDYGFDSATGGMGMLGNWLTYVDLGPGETFSAASICEAIREGRTFATTGPLVFFSIGDARPGDALPPGAYTARIEAWLPFHPWSLGSDTLTTGPKPVGLDTVELVRNGQLVKRWTLPEATPSANLAYDIVESDTHAYYTVHVKGNDGNWLGAVASPIYFAARPLRQPPATTTVEGRSYDAFSGEAKPAIIHVRRHGQVLANASTSPDGFFRLRVPLDSEVALEPFARDAGVLPPPAHRVIDHEPVFARCVSMDRTTLGNSGSYAANAATAGAVIDALRDAVSTIRWEFPLQYQFRGSYVRMALADDWPVSGVTVDNYPPPLSNWTNPACAMLVLDKYGVAPGDTVHYAAVYRAEGNPALSMQPSVCYLKARAWDPSRPSSYATWLNTVHEKNSGLQSLGNGFYAYTGSFTVPAYATNCYQGPGIFVDMYTRVGGVYKSSLGLFLDVGETRRGLLVSSEWPGMPFAWGNHLQAGLGPANLTGQAAHYAIPRNDARTMSVRLQGPTGTVALCPTNDVSLCADADDAYFYDWAHYYGQAANRGVTVRDPVRPQPTLAFPDVPERTVDPFADGFAATPTELALTAPTNNAVFQTDSPIPMACDYLTRGRALTNVLWHVAGPGLAVEIHTGREFTVDFAGAQLPGAYDLFAVAQDDGGMATTSGVHRFHVVLADADGDGLTDAWETQYFGDATNAAAATDSDQDGLSNFGESQAGTDPTNKLSVFTATAFERSAEEQVVIRWSSVSNKTYGLYWTTNLLEGFSPRVAGLPATPPINTYTDTVGQSRAVFYRPVVDTRVEP